MNFIDGIEQLKTSHRPSVVSIGNFDGVHLGHQQVIKSLILKSKELSAPATVITFRPLAKEFFTAGSMARLNPLQQRVDQLFSLGVDQVLVIEFSAEFAAFTPEQFVQHVLVDGLGVRYLCVGDDFRFGKNRVGDFEFLCSSGKQHGFSVKAHQTHSFTTQDVGERRISSGWLREAVQASDFELAAKLLGRRYSISGIVSQGQQLGRTLNYPTANIVLENVSYALKGVFAVQAQVEGEMLNGVANLGTRPTVDGSENRLEVHLFDFDKDIYGQQINVIFKHKVRDEQKFASLDELKAQISVDADIARQYFATHV